MPKDRNKTGRTKNPSQLNREQKQRLRRKLLSWYSSHQRHLPWRQEKNPYAVWVSEVMLQQTQVQTVIPYYLRFLEAFPTVEHLAQADSQELLRLWAGLGYYSRARNLQRAAQEIVRSYGGKFPRSYDEVLSLPGVGRYTAGAVLSIAFDLPYAVLDGNVIRVLSRLFSLRGDPRTRPVQSWLWRRAQELVPNRRPGDFNQAIMELGAVVCSPRRPRCLVCPWQSECQARKDGIQELLPRKRKGTAGQRVYWAVAVIRDRGRVLIVKRTKGRLLKDFWEFPGGEFIETGQLKRALARRVFEESGLRIRLLKPFVTIKHAITHRRITLVAFQARLETAAAAKEKESEAKWVKLDALEKFPFASASQRIVRILQTPGVMPQLRGNAKFALVATASAFLAVGFSRPSAQTHDEFKSEFVVATNALLSPRN